MNRLILLLVLLLATMPTLASLRCGTSLVNLGDKAAQVQEKCGAPAQRRTELPDQRFSNPNRSSAVEVQHWVYGPNNGAVRTLRFIDGKLVNIDIERAH